MLASVGVLGYRLARQSLEDAAVSELLAVAVEKEAALDIWIKERMADVELIARHDELLLAAVQLAAAGPATPEAHAAQAAVRRVTDVQIPGPNGAHLELLLHPQSGTVLAPTLPSQAGRNQLGQAYFEHGRQGLYLSPPAFSADPQFQGMTVAAPLRDTAGRLVAVLAVRLNLTGMGAIVQRRTGLHRSENAYRVNAEAYFVTQPHSTTEPLVLRRRLDTEAGRRLAAQNRGVLLAADFRAVPVITVYRWIARYRLGLLVEMMRTAVAALALPHEASDTAACVTLSVGVASVAPSCMAAVDRVQAADRALYQARRSGRNRVAGAEAGAAAAGNGAADMAPA